jgi:hypothetical protein
VLEPLRLNLEERDQGPHLFLDRLQSDERVELGLELLQAPGRPSGLSRIEPIRQVDLPADPLLDLLPQDTNAAADVVEWACHGRKPTRCACAASHGREPAS